MLRVTALSDLVAVKEDLYYDCQLQEYLEAEKNQKRLEDYYIIQPAKNFLSLIFSETDTGSSHLIFGMCGVGKTHFGIVLANLLGKDFDTEPLKSFFLRLNSYHAELASQIKDKRRKKFLTLVLDGISKEESFKIKFLSFLNGALYREKIDFIPNQDLALSEILKATSEALLKTGLWQGLAVIIDRADSYFKNTPAEVKEFSDFCRRSSFPCKLIALSDLTYQELSGLENLIFDQLHYFTLTTSSFDLEELLQQVFLRRPEPQEYAGLAKEKDLKAALTLIKKYNLYPGKPEEWIKETALLGCYPFHPFALFTLARLAEKLGDEKRNFRNFFIDNLPGTLANFVQNLALYQPNGRLSMYTIDYLYSYYKSNISAKAEYKPLIKALEKIQPLTAELIFSGRILSLLAILYVINHPFLPATSELIIESLQLIPRETEKVKDTLDALVRKDALLFNEETKVFSLNLPQPELDIEAALNLEKENLRKSWDVPAFFKNLYPDFKIIPQAFNEEKHTDKAAEILFIAAQKLLDPQFTLNPEAILYNSNTYKADLLVVYPFAFNQEEYEALKQRVEKGDFRNPHLLIALPNSLFSLLNDAIEMEAIRRILNFYQPYCEPYYPGREKLEARFAELKQNLNLKVKEYLQANNFTWHYQEKFFKLNPGEEAELLSKVFYELFPKLPVLDIQGLSYHKITPEARKLEKECLEILLNAKDEVILNQINPALAEEVLKTLLVKQGWLKELARGTFWTKFVPCVPPEESALYPVWKQMSNMLAGNERGVKLTYLEDFYREFAKPPYGLNRRVATILLAYFLFKYRLQLSIYSKVPPHSEEPAGTPEPLSLPTLVNLEKDPLAWAVYFSEYTSIERELLLEILKIFAPDLKLDYKTLLWDEAVEALQSWEHQIIPLCKFAAPHKSSFTNSFIQWLSKEETYLNPVSFIKEKLLAALEYDPETFNWEIDINNLKQRIKQAYDEVRVSDQLFKESILKEIMLLFKAKDLKSLEQNLTKWLDNLPKASKENPPNDDGRALMEVLSIGSPISEVFLSELPEAFGIGSVERWEEDLKQVYLARLAYAKLSLEVGLFKGSYLIWKDRNIMRGRLKQRIVAMLHESGINPAEAQELLEAMLESANG
jgi:hypothetical protein